MGRGILEGSLTSTNKLAYLSRLLWDANKFPKFTVTIPAYMAELLCIRPTPCYSSLRRRSWTEEAEIIIQSISHQCKHTGNWCRNTQL